MNYVIYYLGYMVYCYYNKLWKVCAYAHCLHAIIRRGWM